MLPFFPASHALRQDLEVATGQIEDIYLWLVHTHTWLWVKNAVTPKWSPDKRNQRLKPAVFWWVYFDPYPHRQVSSSYLPVILLEDYHLS